MKIKISLKFNIKNCSIDYKIPPRLFFIAIFFLIIFSAFHFLFFITSADAAGINNQINFQGKLVNSNGTNVTDGNYTIVFSLYNVSSGGTAIWTETDTVTTSSGIFQVALGSNSAFPGSVDFNNSSLYLGIKVGTDTEMTPRIRFSAVPYAFNASALDDVVATESATGFSMQGGTSSLSTVSFSNSGSNLTFQPGVSEGLALESNGANGLTLDTGGGAAIDIGTINATSVAFGKSSNNTSFIFNNGTGGFSVNGTGNVTFSALNSADGLVYTSGTNGILSQTTPTGASQCLQSNSSNNGLTWISCSSAGTNYWQLNSGALSPANVTNDLLLGATATTSAKIALEFIAGGTPVASVSSQTGNAPTGISMSGNGSIQALNMNSLTIGGTTTGDIIFDSGSNVDQFNDNSINLTGSAPVITSTNTLQLNTGANTLTFNQGGSGQVQFFGTTNFITSTGALTLAGTGNALNLSGTGADINFSGTGTAAEIVTQNNQYLALDPGGTGNIIFNATTTPLASLDIRANSGTLAIASVSGATSFAGLVINNSGAGDLFAASKSGTTKFVINSQGNVGIGTATPLAALDVRATSATTAIASVAGSTTFAGLVINNSGSGDLFTASSAGRTKFTVSNSGNVFFGGDTISASASGSTNNGSPDVINGLGDTGSLVPNAGFEADQSHSQLSDGWVPSATDSGTLILDTTQADAAQGTDSIKWTTTATNQSAAFYSACFPLTGIAADTYNLVWAQKGSAANALTVRGNIDEYTSKANCMSNTGLTSSATAPATAITASWADTAGTTAIAPTAGETWGRVHIFMASGANGVSGWIDAVRLIESSLQDGLDYAEDYPADPNNIPQPGQVVSLVASGSGSVVAPTDIYMDQSAIGVVSTNPGEVLDDGSMTNPVPIALAGRVPVNVSTANGPIQVGDYLTSSNIPGVAVRATSSGSVIGTAMEEDTDTNTSDVSQITMFIKNTYYDGGSLSSDSGLDLLSGAQDPSVLLTILQGVESASSSAISSLSTGQVTAGFNYLLSAMTNASSQSANFSDRIVSSSSTPRNNGLLNDTATLSGLTVNGSATVSADLNVQGNGLVEGILHIVDTLFANDFIANGVSDFFGNVIFHSGVTFQNTPVFDSDTAGFAIIKKGSDQVDVTFATPYEQTPIVNASITLNPITPTPSETAIQQQQQEEELENQILSNNIHYIIINRTTTGFAILLKKPAKVDISFSWVALAVNTPMIFQSDGQNIQFPTPSEEISPSPIDTIIPTNLPVSPIITPTGEVFPTPTPLSGVNDIPGMSTSGG